jgi:hypothetical protein
MTGVFIIIGLGLVVIGFAVLADMRDADDRKEAAVLRAIEAAEAEQNAWVELERLTAAQLASIRELHARLLEQRTNRIKTAEIKLN